MKNANALREEELRLTKDKEAHKEQMQVRWTKTIQDQEVILALCIASS